MPFHYIHSSLIPVLAYRPFFTPYIPLLTSSFNTILFYSKHFSLTQFFPHCRLKNFRFTPSILIQAFSLSLTFLSLAAYLFNSLPLHSFLISYIYLSIFILYVYLSVRRISLHTIPFYLTDFSFSLFLSRLSNYSLMCVSLYVSIPISTSMCIVLLLLVFLSLFSSVSSCLSVYQAISLCLFLEASN